MPDVLSFIPAAFLAGVLMFLAPCTLPLVPGYLAFIAGVPGRDTATSSTAQTRRRLMRNALFFVLGFSLIFMLLGLFAGSIGSLLLPWRSVISRVAGAIIIIFGLTMLGILRIPALMSERRIRLPHFIVVGRPESSFLIGALFALGWSPCIGPILGTVLLFASTSATALQGALLLGVFSLGLGLPFILTAYLIGHSSALFVRAGSTVQLLSKAAGALLVVFGALMLVGSIDLLFGWATALFSLLGFDSLLGYL